MIPSQRSPLGITIRAHGARAPDPRSNAEAVHTPTFSASSEQFTCGRAVVDRLEPKLDVCIRIFNAFKQKIQVEMWAHKATAEAGGRRRCRICSAKEGRGQPRPAPAPPALVARDRLAVGDLRLRRPTKRAAHRSHPYFKPLRSSIDHNIRLRQLLDHNDLTVALSFDTPKKVLRGRRPSATTALIVLHERHADARTSCVPGQVRVGLRAM
ncbi:hypothetical protein EVAR_23333_1 [Eumeta japonica]|uniref:Uncharacterized protein n=1 Tax=Eumeta variegata TaxID=151549 RepID=A0A4C1Y044_EUMVA|nr:hypothetical protein EVAR_23333_1 [Eumeta japonica]